MTTLQLRVLGLIWSLLGKMFFWPIQATELTHYINSFQLDSNVMWMTLVCQEPARHIMLCVGQLQIWFFKKCVLSNSGYQYHSLPSHYWTLGCKQSMYLLSVKIGLEGFLLFSSLRIMGRKAYRVLSALNHLLSKNCKYCTNLTASSHFHVKKLI